MVLGQPWSTSRFSTIQGTNLHAKELERTPCHMAVTAKQPCSPTTMHAMVEKSLQEQKNRSKPTISIVDRCRSKTKNGNSVASPNPCSAYPTPLTSSTVATCDSSPETTLLARVQRGHQQRQNRLPGAHKLLECKNIENLLHCCRWNAS